MAISLSASTRWCRPLATGGVGTHLQSQLPGSRAAGGSTYWPPGMALPHQLRERPRLVPDEPPHQRARGTLRACCRHREVSQPAFDARDHGGGGVSCSIGERCLGGGCSQAFPPAGLTPCRADRRPVQQERDRCFRAISGRPTQPPTRTRSGGQEAADQRVGRRPVRSLRGLLGHPDAGLPACQPVASRVRAHSHRADGTHCRSDYLSARDLVAQTPTLPDSCKWQAVAQRRVDGAENQYGHRSCAPAGPTQVHPLSPKIIDKKGNTSPISIHHAYERKRGQACPCGSLSGRPAKRTVSCRPDSRAGLEWSRTLSLDDAAARAGYTVDPVGAVLDVVAGHDPVLVPASWRHHHPVRVAADGLPRDLAVHQHLVP